MIEIEQYWKRIQTFFLLLKLIFIKAVIYHVFIMETFAWLLIYVYLKNRLEHIWQFLQSPFLAMWKFYQVYKNWQTKLTKFSV